MRCISCSPRTNTRSWWHSTSGGATGAATPSGRFGSISGRFSVTAGAQCATCAAVQTEQTDDETQGERNGVGGRGGFGRSGYGGGAGSGAPDGHTGDRRPGSAA